MPAPIYDTPLLPVRQQDDRPLPVAGGGAGLSCGPGPIYPGKDGFPDTFGKGGRKVTIQHRHPTEEDPIPPPGPGEYDPDEPYGKGWQSRERRERMFGWRSGTNYYARPEEGKPTQEGRVVRDDQAPRRIETDRSAFFVKRGAAKEPGPGHYTHEHGCTAQSPKKRSCWRFNPVYNGRGAPADDDPRRVETKGPSMGRTARAPRPPDGPGPGAYETKGDLAERVARERGGAGGRTGPRPPTPPKHQQQQQQDAVQVPGPGHYDQSYMTTKKLSHMRPISMAPRPWDPEPQQTPGPGQYAPLAPSAKQLRKRKGGAAASPATPGSVPGTPGSVAVSPQSAHDQDRAVRKKVHGPRWAPPKGRPPVTEDRRDYGPVVSDFGREGAGVSIHRPCPPPRRPRFPPPPRDPQGGSDVRAAGQVVLAQISACAPLGTRAVVVDHYPDRGVYLLRIERSRWAKDERAKEGREIEVEASKVRRCDADDGPGPGEYSDGPLGTAMVDGIGRSGRAYTIQSQNERTKMVAAFERRRGEPGPSDYFREGDDGAQHPAMRLGASAPAHTIAARVPLREDANDIGPGQYDPAPPPDASGRGGVLSFRPAVRVQVKGDIDEVRQLCEEAGIREWRDGREWRARRDAGDDGDDAVAKDDYCGMEGVLITHGGMLRARGPTAQAGPNQKPAPAAEAKVPGAPWAPYSNRSRETLRVVFNDPPREKGGTFAQPVGGWIEWSYPPEALLRNRIPFEEANARDGWAAPSTKAPGGPALYNPQQESIGSVRERRDAAGNTVVEVPGATIKGRPPPPPPPHVPGPGQHWQEELPSTLTEKGVVIGTGV